MNTIGICEYCGQVVTPDRDYGSEEENNKNAAYRCNCGPSREAKLAQQKRQRQIDQAIEAISNLFESETEENLYAIEPDSAEVAVSLLKAAVIPVIDRHLFRVSIDIGGVKAVISRSGKNKIVVERSDATKRKLEV